MTGISWTAHESALWEGCRILAAGGNPRAVVAPHPTTFRLLDPRDEVVIGEATYHRKYFGMGERRSNQLLGLGRAISNALATCDSWRDLDAGTLWISTHGFYLLNGSTPRVLAFGWASISSARMVGPQVMEHVVELEDGSFHQHRLVSLWSELAFGLWTECVSPHHPQRVDLAWLPPGFVQRVVDNGLWESSPLPALYVQSAATVGPSPMGMSNQRGPVLPRRSARAAQNTEERTGQ